MLIKSIELNGLVPLTHGDIDKVSITVTQPIQIIIGDNGCGKTSLINELTKACSNKPSYKKNGYRIITGIQNDTEYKIGSDFREPKGPHTFIKDGEELNISGTTVTQVSLNEDHLGLTSVIDDLINFRYHMCSMSKSDRKQFFLSIYPSDLSFILQDHKRISSELRGFKSNLKMLKERQLILSNKLMCKDELNELYRLQKQTIKDIAIIDRVVYMTEHEQNTLRRNTSILPDDDTIFSIEQIRSKCSEITSVILRYKESHPNLFQERTFIELSQTLETDIHKKLLTKEQLSETTISLQTEILELKETDISVEEEFNKLTTNITTLKELLAKSIVDPKVPVLSDTELNNVESNVVPQLRSIIDSILTCEGRVITLTQVNKVKNKLSALESKMSDLREELTRLESVMERLLQRRSKETKYTFPNNCNEVCELRDNSVNILKITDQEIAQITGEMTKIKRLQYSHTQAFKIVTDKFKYLTYMVPLLHELDRIFKSGSWIEFILKDVKLIELLNNNPFDIVNKLILVINNTKVYNCRCNYENQLNLLNMKLSTLKNAKLPTKELISKTLIDKQTQLNVKTSEYIKLQVSLKDLQFQLSASKELSKYCVEVERLHKLCIDRCHYLTQQMELDLYKTIVRDCMEHKTTLNKTLVEIEATVNEQESYQIRLNQEVLPSIDEIELKIVQWTHVERALNPSSGLPHIYMVRYMNNLISNVNKLLSVICGYSLVINPIEMDKVLDFTLPIMVKYDHNVPDVSKCSEGQKQMIDLVWTIVVCQQLGINKIHPLILDEPDSALSNGNRSRLLDLLSTLVRQGDIAQLFLINHHAALHGMVNSEVFCMSTENVVVPAVYNEHVKIN